MPITTDRNDPDLREHNSDGQQKAYLVLSPEERKKGFVRPVMTSYTHLACGAVTNMGLALSETYARNPAFYSGTFCSACQKHFPLRDEAGAPNFLWPDLTPVGSSPEEAAPYLAKAAEDAAREQSLAVQRRATSLVSDLAKLPVEAITPEVRAQLRKLLGLEE